MSEGIACLRARAAGRDFLLPLSDLREVVEVAPVVPLPGGPRGIRGVVLHHGEFLPVLDWEDALGRELQAPPAVLAVLRPRLGLPLEALSGTVEVAGEGHREVPENDRWAQVLSGMVQIGDQDVPLLDPDRLLSLLHRLRSVR